MIPYESEVIPIKTPVSRVGNKSAILHILYALFPLKYGRFVDVFGGSGSVLLGKPEVTAFEVYNDFDHNLVNLFHCMKERTMAVIRELGFCNLNSREDFNAIENLDDMSDVVCDGDCENCPISEIDCDGDCQNCPCYKGCDESEVE